MKNLFKLFNFVFIPFLLIIFFVSLQCSKKEEDKINLGVAYYKVPTKEKISKTKFGEVPVNQFAVILKKNFGKKDAEKIGQEYGGKVVGELEYINLFQIETNFSSEEELTKALSELSNKQEVEYAFVNAAVYLDDVTSVSCDPLDDELYRKDSLGAAYDMINLKGAWDLIKASGLELCSVKVGVNDQILSKNTEELKGNVKISSDKFSDEKEISHGNAVTNTIAADARNGGVTGVASVLGDKLKINFIDNEFDKPEYKETDKPDEEDITQIEYKGKSYIFTTFVKLKEQIESGAKVINCSFGVSPDTNRKHLIKGFEKFIGKMAKEHPDVIFVKSAGNNNTAIDKNNRELCENLPNVISVGALDVNGNRASYSNYSKNPGDGSITLSACGFIPKETTEKGILRGQGTSYATPQVTGVIAIMKSLNPKLTAEQIKEILIKTASKKIKDKEVPPEMGAGCLNAEDAVFWVIKDLWNQKELKPNPLTKEYLLNLALFELVATGGPKDFVLTASIKGIGEKEAKFEIEISGTNYVLKGEKNKSLSSAGSISWEISLGDNSEGVTAKVKRLDVERCKYVILGGKVKAEDLVGQWTGTVIMTDWSTSSALVRQYSAGIMNAEVGKPKELLLDVRYIDDNSVGISMQVKGGKAIPTKTFSFVDEKLHAEFSAHFYNYVYDAIVENKGGKIVLSGTWTAVTNMLSTKGTWSAELKK